MTEGFAALPARARPSGGPDARTTAEPSRSWFRRNLEHSLPFLIVGAVCIGLAVWLAASSPHSGGHRLALWVLLAAVGATIGGGGAALTFVDEPETPEPVAEDGAFVRVSRDVWDRFQQARVAAVAQPWDEDTEEVAAPPAAESPGTPEEPAVQTVPDEPTLDPSMVAEASEALLASPPPSVVAPPAPPPPTPVPAVPPDPPRAAAPPPPAPPAPRPAPAPAPVTSSGSSRPAWQEQSIQELESMLAQLEKPAASGSAAPSAARPAPGLEPCVGCGAAGNVYSEQVCVVCTGHLCDNCMEQSVADGRPGICPNCHAAPAP